MTLDPSWSHGTTPRQGGLDSLTCAIIFDESPRKPAEDVKLWNCTIPQNKEASKNMSGTNTINTWRKLPRTWLYLKCSSQNVFNSCRTRPMNEQTTFNTKMLLGSGARYVSSVNGHSCKRKPQNAHVSSLPLQCRSSVCTYANWKHADQRAKKKKRCS